MFLESLGADTFVYSAFQPYAARGLVLGRVAISQRDRYHLITTAGEFPAEPSGTLCYRAANRSGMPVTGDWVAVRMDSLHAIIEAVLPRKTLFSRRTAGRCEDEQPVAANIDLVFLVCGLDGDFNLRRLERYLTLAAEAGTAPVVVLNKRDLCTDIQERLRAAGEVARGAPILATTTMTSEGADELHGFLGYGRTVALLGSSGVGKSALINSLLGEERLRTAEVRASDNRGRHTTTTRELIPLSAGGAVIDTPGMRELQLWARQNSVDRTFEEITDIATQCRFRDCAHSGEPGCAVAAAIVEGVVSGERWASYSKLTAEARRHAELSDRLLAISRKKRDKAMERGIRAFYREKGR